MGCLASHPDCGVEMLGQNTDPSAVVSFNHPRDMSSIDGVQFLPDGYHGNTPDAEHKRMMLFRDIMCDGWLPALVQKLSKLFTFIWK